jgi:hypothetical protein
VPPGSRITQAKTQMKEAGSRSRIATAGQAT